MSATYLQQLFGLDGQVAVITGGLGVLGLALADGLARAGATLVLAGRPQDRVDDKLQAITSLSPQSIFVPCDAGDKKCVQDLLTQTQKQFGQVDMLINCVGSNSQVPYADIPEEEWHRVVDSILMTTHLGCQVFAPAMAQQANGGSILNIGSVTAHLPLSRVFAYSAAKAAVVNLTKNLAREYAPQNVRVNVLCPGFFPAEQNRKILDAERVQNILTGTPQHRFGEPKELVAAALLLLSRVAGSYITGEDLYVDGGFTSARF